MNDLRLNSHSGALKEAINPGTSKVAKADEAQRSGGATVSAFALQLEADGANRNARAVVTKPTVTLPAMGLEAGQTNWVPKIQDPAALNIGLEPTGESVNIETAPRTPEIPIEGAITDPGSLTQFLEGDPVQQNLVSDDPSRPAAGPVEAGPGPQLATNLAVALIVPSHTQANVPASAGEVAVPRQNEPDARKSLFKGDASADGEEAPSPNPVALSNNRPLPGDGMAATRGLASHSEQMKFEDDLRLMNGSVTRVSVEHFSESAPLTRQIAQPIVQELDSMGEAAGHVPGHLSNHTQRTVVRKLSLQLNPAELGVLKIDLRLQGGGLSVQISAEQATTVELLGHERKQLLESLVGSGYQGCEVSINHMQVDTTPRTLSMGDNQWNGATSSGDHGFGKERQPSGKEHSEGSPQRLSPNTEDGPTIEPLNGDVTVGRRVYV